MRRVFTIGETVWDILIRNNEPFTAKAGGACLNSAVSLGRIGIPTYYIGEFGLDEVGKNVEEFLQNNNVNTDCVYRFHDGKTPLALAFLNEHNEASYEFYHVYPKDRLNIEFPEILKNDIILFGSIYSITAEVRKQLTGFLAHARKQKAIIIYDPNFRKQHIHELKKLKPFIEENLKFADIVRGSNIDFSFIFGTANSKETYEIIRDKVSYLFYTNSTEAVYLHTPNTWLRIPVEEIEPLSTIGAGDSFNAGIIYYLIRENIGLKDLAEIKSSDWEKIIHTAIEFANHVCMRYDNYISRDFAGKFKF